MRLVEPQLEQGPLRLKLARAELVRHIAEMLPEDGELEPVEGLLLKRCSEPSELVHSVYQPSFNVVAQGKKEVGLGRELYIYDPERYLITSADLPVTSQVVEASSDRPYLSLRLVLDPYLVGAVLVEAGLSAPRSRADVKAIDAGCLDVDLLEAVVRFVRLLGTPQHARVLGPAIVHEIVYRLLIGDQGARLRHIALLDGGAHRITQAISWLRRDFDRPLRIESVAREVGMSPSGFHHHFKTVTSMSPLQFQKRLRLQEARRLLLSENLDAASAGYRVGYDDASHFNREYKRLFGAPPLQDAERLRKGRLDLLG